MGTKNQTGRLCQERQLEIQCTGTVPHEVAEEKAVQRKWICHSAWEAGEWCESGVTGGIQIMGCKKNNTQLPCWHSSPAGHSNLTEHLPSEQLSSEALAAGLCSCIP